MTAVDTGITSASRAAFDAGAIRTPQVMKSWATSWPRIPSRIKSRTSSRVATIFGSRATRKMSRMVERAMGKVTANSGPICSCTSLTITNWLAHIRLHASSSSQSMNFRFLSVISRSPG